MAKSKKLVTSLAALAVSAAAVSPAITADAAAVNPVVLKAKSFRGGVVELPTMYGNSRIVWDRSTIDWNQINKFQTVYGVVGSQERPIQMQINLLNYPIFAEKAEPQVIKLGEKPVLPERLNIKFVDKFYPNAIKWEEAPVADKEGTFFVKGTYTKDGRTVVTSALYTVEGVEDKEAPELKYEGPGVYDIENGAKFELPTVKAMDNVDEEIEVTHVIKDASGKELDAIDTKVAGKYTITFMAEDKAGNKAKPVEIQVMVAEALPKVESVEAIDSTNFKVVFSKEIKSVLPSNFVITQKDNGTRYYVKDAVLSADKKSAIVTVYDALVEGKAYTVETSNIEDVEGKKFVDSDEFTYVKAVPATITFASKLPQAASVDLDEFITVKDAAGNEIKTGYTVNYTSNQSVATGNIVNTSGLTSITVNASITKADGTKVTTGNLVLAVEPQTAASIDTFKLVSGTSSVEVGTLFLDASKALDKEGNAIVGAAAANLDLSATFKDQFGKDINVADEKYESLTPTVLTITPSGDVIPVSTGKALVRVTKGNLSKTIELEVKANPELTTIEAVDTVSVVGASTAPAGSLKVTLKDQYGNKFDGNVTATSADASVATVSNATTTNGEATLVLQGLKEGSTKVTITVGALKKEVTVTAIKAGSVANYAIEATDATIDLNNGANNGTATVKVYEIDAAGNKVREISTDNSISYVLPTTGSLIKSTGSKNVFDNATSNTTAGSTVVTVKAGSLVLGTVTINTVNTTDSVAAVELVNSLVKLDSSALVTGFNINEIAKNIKMTTKSGKVLDNSVSADLAAKVSAIDEVISSDSSAVGVSSKTTVAAQTVSGAKKTTTLVVKFKDSNIAPIAFNVEVSDVTAPNTPVLSLATVKGGANVSIVAPATGETAWLAPAGTTTFVAGATMTKLEGNGTANTILAPTTAGVYKLFLVDLAGNVSVPSSNALTVDNTPPEASSYVLNENSTNPETITITLSEALDLNDGDAVTGFTTSTGTGTATYDATNKKVVITSANDSEFSVATTVSYNPATGNVVDVAGNELATVTAANITQ